MIPFRRCTLLVDPIPLERCACRLPDVFRAGGNRADHLRHSVFRVSFDGRRDLSRSELSKTSPRLPEPASDFTPLDRNP